MAINKISGNILQDNLQRGTDLSIQGNLIYFDVVNDRVGVLTSSPQDDFNVVGTANATDVRITSSSSDGIFFSDANKLAKTSANLTWDGDQLYANSISTTRLDLGNGNVNAGNVNVIYEVSASTGYFTGNVDILGNLNATVGIVYANSGIFYGNAQTGTDAAFAGVPGFTPLGSNVIMQFAGNVNSYAQLNFENINTGNAASTDIVLTADNGDDSTYYVDLGLSGSNHTGEHDGFFGDTGTSNDGYLYVVASDSAGPSSTGGPGNLILGSTNGIVKIFVGNTAQANVVTEFTTDAANFYNNVNITGNAVVGNISVTNVTTTGNITGDYVIANSGIFGSVTTDDIFLGNITANGFANITGNITGGNIDTVGEITAVGNVTGGNLNTSGNAVVGNILTDNYYYANGAPVDFQQPAGANTQIQYNDDSDFGASANLTYDQATGILQIGYGNSGIVETDFVTVGSNITTGNAVVGNNTTTNTLDTIGNAFIGGNLTVQGNITYINIDDLQVEDPVIILGTGPNGSPLSVNDGKDRGAQLNYYNTGLNQQQSAFVGWDNSTGNMIAASNVIVTSDVATVIDWGTFQAGYILGDNIVSNTTIVAGGNISTTANVISGNVETAGIYSTTVNVTGNLTAGNITTNGIANIATLEVTGTTSLAGNVISPLNVTGDVNSGNLFTWGEVSAIGNITGGNLLSNNDIVASQTVFSNNISVTSGIFATGNITGGNLVSNAWVSGVDLAISNSATVIANITTGNLDTGAGLVTTGNITVLANVSSGNIINLGTVDSIGNITTSANVQADYLIANSAIVGNVTITDLSVGNIDATGYANITGNITGGNLITLGNADVGGIRTDNYYYANGAPVDFEQPAGANTQIQYNDDSDFGANANFTYNYATGVLAVGYGNSGSILTDLVTITGNVSANNAIIGNGFYTDTLQTTGNAIIGGNLTVQGNVTYINVETFDIEDPIISIGTGANDQPLVTDDGKDRGLAMDYYNTGLSQQQTAFVGYDNSSSGNLILAANVTIANEIVTVIDWGTVQGGNAYFGNALIDGVVTIGTLDIDNLSVPGNIVGGNITSNALITGVTLDLSGNATVGNLTANSDITATETVYSNNSSISNNVYVGGVVTALGNITGGNLVSNAWITGVDLVISNSAVVTANITAGNVLVGSGLIESGNLTVAANVTSGNIINLGSITSTGNITTPANVQADYFIANSAIVGNVTITDLSVGNIDATGYANVLGNVLGGNLITVGNADVGGIRTDNYYYANGAPVDFEQPAGANTQVQYNDDSDFGASANLTYNYATGVLAVGYGNSGEILTETITANTTAVIGNTVIANTTITTDLGYGNITVGPTGNALAIIDTVSGLVIPVGSTAERPAPAPTGTVRFNVDINRVEIYDGTGWEDIAANITNQLIYGDNSTTVFLLDRSSTTAAVLVCLNGIVQVPNLAYTVTGNSLAFAQAPAVSDVIDIRFL